MAKKKSYPPMGLYDKFKFGMYKGKNLKDVLDLDVSYITHILNEDIIELDNGAYEEYSVSMDY